jgi:ATP-dependent Clp endopeptidase proteolytic subunit ClpP
MLYNAVLPLLLSNMAIDKDPVLDNIPTLSDHGIMVLMGEIDAESVRPVVEWVLYENYVKKKKLKELLLMICSEGGDLSVAFALIDVMRTSKIPIKTVGLGQIASCGLLIFLSGAVGRRVLTANTSIMSHQFSWGTEGKAHELFATMKEFELTQQRMVNLYKSTTGLDEETIKTVLLPAQDVYLSAEEALSYGICDHVG